MKNKKIINYILSLLMFLMFVSSSSYAIERTQEIQLEKGWNAVYLEVDPVVEKQNLSAYMMPKGEDNKTVSTPISIIATYYPRSSSVEYIDDPSKSGWKKATWNRWIRDDLEDSFLTNLYDLEANQGYLVKADKAFVWKVKGEVRDLKRRWQPNSFNLVGFNVVSPAPTFYQYFQNNLSVKALAEGPVYSLVNGQWKKVNMLDTAIEPNKAYWVYSKNTTEFQGVLDVEEESGSSELAFLDIVNRKTISLKNSSSQSISVVVSLENNHVPLSLIGKNNLFETTYTAVNTHVKTLNIAGNENAKLELAVRRNEITGNEKQEGLLKFLVSGVNEVQYIPLSAYGGK